MQASIWATFKSKAESLVSSKARKALCIQIALRGREHLVHWNQLNAYLPKRPSGKIVLFYFLLVESPSLPLLLHLSLPSFMALVGSYEKACRLMKMKLLYWASKRWRWSEQNLNGHSQSIKGFGSAGRVEGQSATSHFIDCTKKNLNDADSCPRFGSDLESKVNAEPKSFPEGSGCTKCYSNQSEWLYCHIFEVMCFHLIAITSNTWIYHSQKKHNKNTKFLKRKSRTSTLAHQ